MHGDSSARAWQVLSAQCVTISLITGCVCVRSPSLGAPVWSTAWDYM